MRTMKQKFISANKVAFERLKGVFGCSDKMIYNALSFDKERGNSDLAKRIRHTAKILGCHTYVVVDETECFFDTTDGIMRQLCPNGAQIEVSKETGKGVIIYKGDVVAEYNQVMVSQIPSIQARAMAF